MSERRGIALVAGACTIWGSLAVVIPLAGSTPAVLVAMRMVFGAVALAGWCAYRWRGQVIRQKEWKALIAIGVVLALHWLCFFTGVEAIGSSAIVINYIFPVIVAIVGPRVLVEARERMGLPAAVLGLSGAAVIIGPSLSSRNYLGVGAALGSAVLASVLFLMSRRVVDHVPGAVVALWNNTVGATVMIPLALLTGASGVPWRWGLLLGGIHTALAGIVFLGGLRQLSAQRAGVLMYLEPVTAIVWVAALGYGMPSWNQLIGAALVVCAGALLMIRPRSELAVAHG